MKPIIIPRGNGLTIPSGLSSEQWSERLIVPLYKGQFVETLWNARKPENRARGWELKRKFSPGKKMKAPWFFNMRPAGDAPVLFNGICQSMAEMIALHDVNNLIGVEMAGVPLVGGISAYFYLMGREMRIGYTRPLPGKARDPLEAMKMLAEIDAHPEVADYSEKSFLEARLRTGDKLAIGDDMATDLGSKIIGRLIVLWQAKHDAIDIANCDSIFYFLNRTRGNVQKGLDFMNEPEQGLSPARLHVRYVLEFDDNLPLLKKVMTPAEYETTWNFQNDPSFQAAYQDEKERAKIIELAARGV